MLPMVGHFLGRALVSGGNTDVDSGQRGALQGLIHFRDRLLGPEDLARRPVLGIAVADRDDGRPVLSRGHCRGQGIDPALLGELGKVHHELRLRRDGAGHAHIQQHLAGHVGVLAAVAGLVARAVDNDVGEFRRRDVKRILEVTVDELRRITPDRGLAGIGERTVEHQDSDRLSAAVRIRKTIEIRDLRRQVVQGLCRAGDEAMSAASKIGFSHHPVVETENRFNDAA